ncbi:HAD-IIB family hydrolase [Erysipelotrichaceae bacterium OH741_COT-311]|nr:HAD-IIB family hydrolase [Erysipelotrichaceae bacterium OH741_COT-311]
MKIIASDYDGTLKQQEEIPLTIKQKIIEFQNAGHLFGIITGRSLITIVEELEKQDIKVDFIVASNGSVIVDGNGKLLFEQTIKTEVAKKLLNHFETHNYPFYACNDGYHVYGRYDSVDPRAQAHKKRHENLQVSKEVMLASNHIISFVVRGDDLKHKEALYHDVVTHFGDEVNVIKNLWVFDIMAKDISKKTGLDFIKKYYGSDEIYAIGDDYNDFDMILAYKGYCVDNAIEVVKEVAVKSYTDVGELIEDVI